MPRKELFSSIVASARTFRHFLHNNPYVSNDEAWTAKKIVEFLDAGAGIPGVRGIQPLQTGCGGHGLIYEIRGSLCDPKEDYPSTVLLRSDMDALPLQERPSDRLPSRAPVSSRPGAHHACGHDGHTAMLSAALLLLNEHPEILGGGRVIGIFQPAEETGDGAIAMVEAERERNGDPDASIFGPRSISRGAFAFHNIPGRAFGNVLFVRDGVAARASTGLEVRVIGAASHASEPHLGRSPMPVLAALAQRAAGIPQELEQISGRSLAGPGGPALVTPVHMHVGNPGDFGVLPASGKLCMTLRADDTHAVEALVKAVHEAAEEEAQRVSEGYEITLERVEPFPAVVNSVAATDIMTRAADAVRGTWESAGEFAEKCEVVEMEKPFPWSEDFAHFASECGKGALVGLGVGEKWPALHAQDYDFNDDLLPLGTALWVEIAREALK